MRVLDIQNLQVAAGEKPLVKGISLQVDAGKTLCLVGESGSGKSLTAYSIMGLLPGGLSITEGTLTFDGKDLRTLTPRQYRSLRGREMAMVFQEPLTALNPVMRVGEQVAEVFKIHTPLTHAQRYAAVLELFEKVQLDDAPRRYDAYPHELSGGQRQRVMIAMALALKPKLLIADEPTTALDVTVQGEILQLIKNLQSEMNMAVLFITHDFGVVEKIADSVAVMEHGKLVEQGSVAEVVRKPKQAYTQKLVAAMPRLVVDKPLPPPVKGEPLLQVEKLDMQFTLQNAGLFTRKKTFQALKNINFTLHPGETLGVVGESGCGKSTLARCLIRLYQPNGGRVVFQGKAIQGLRGKALRAMRRDMQMIFQDPFSSLNPRMKIGDSVAEGLRAHNIMPAAERRDFVAHLLEECGMPADSMHRYPHQFSGGQRQRICIARALALRPALVLADEAVSSLDVSVQAQILELMATLKQKYNLSYFFISHDLRVVSQVADRVLVMHKGQIVEQGAVRDVFGNPQHSYTQTLLRSIPGGS